MQISILLLIIFFTTLGYVVLNFIAAIFIISIAKRISLELKKRQIIEKMSAFGAKNLLTILEYKKKLTLFFTQKKMIWVFACMIIPFLFLVQISTNTSSIWTYSFCLLALGLTPIFVLVIAFDDWLFSVLPKSLLTKFAFSTLFLLSAWVVRVNVLDELNKFFPIDPYSMPIAVLAGTALGLLGFFSLVTALITVILFAAGMFIMPTTSDFSQNKIIRFLVCSLPLITYVVIYVATGAQSFLGLSPMRTLLINRIAFEYDFNSNFLCHKIENGTVKPLTKKEKVLFLGSTQKLGVAASADDIDERWPLRISNDLVLKYSPKNFSPVVCNEP